ncbi:MAG: AMP-binding protein [Thermodesulfobacteriota bacterium]
MNLAKNLERSALWYPERPAVSEGASVWTYAELDNRANRIATALLGMGIKPGDHVGLCTPNSGDWMAFYFGVIKTGAVAVTYSYMLRKNELELLVGHACPRVLFTMEEKLEALKGLRGSGGVETVICDGGDLTLDLLMAKGSGTFKALDRDRADTAAILYTGGTTGTPKGVMLTHENINAAIQTVVYNEQSTERDRALCCLPFNHIFGQMHIMNATLLSAGCAEILPTFEMERVLELMAAGRITKFYAVPTIYVRFLALDRLRERLGAVRYCFSAAASMPAELVRQWKERTGLAIFEGYGLTETSPCLTFNHRHRHVIGSVGTEVWNVEIQIRDESGNPLETGRTGEICARGPNIMKGYLDNPKDTEAAFWPGRWLRTGDLGIQDENGYFFIVDRLKDMIITGGENVYPREVEEILYTVQAIEECAVIGLPDREWGERVTAVIVTKPGKTVTPAELKDYLKGRLSPYKVPKEFHIVNDLPKSAAGKILKRDLRDRLKGK